MCAQVHLRISEVETAISTLRLLSGTNGLASLKVQLAQNSRSTAEISFRNSAQYTGIYCDYQLILNHLGADMLNA